MRLIDADALKKDLKQYFTDGVLDGVSARLAFNQILHDIDNAPTVSPERPQGEWIIDQEGDKNTITLVTCPFCGERHCCKMNFCGNCGADMRKGGAE